MILASSCMLQPELSAISLRRGYCYLLISIVRSQVTFCELKQFLLFRVPMPFSGDVARHGLQYGLIQFT